MRYTCDEIHRKKYKKLRTLFIPLCLDSHDIYYFNILRVVNIFTIFTFSVNYMSWHIKNRTILHDSIFIQKKVSRFMILHGNKDLVKIITV